MKSYVPSSRSIASSREHTNVEPRIFTRADSFVKNSYTSGVTLSSPLDRQRTRIRAGGIFVALETSSIAAFRACRSAKVGARSSAFTNTAKPAAPRLVTRHNVDGSRRTYASNEYVSPVFPVSSAGVTTAPGIAIIPRTSARGPQILEDALDRVLSLGNIHDRIRLTDALDDAMPEGEVVEERPQVAHQLEDAEAEDEEGHQDGSEE